MRQDSSPAERSAALGPHPVAGAGAGPSDGAVALPRPPWLTARLPLPVPRIAVRPLAGRVAMGTLLLCAAAVVVVSTSGPNALVPRSTVSFPHWFSGPLHGLIPQLGQHDHALEIGFSAVLLIMSVAYLVVVASARMLSMRLIVACIVALHVILLMSPPLQLTDVFNYIGYARLGGLHNLNPYTHVIAAATHDPVYRLTTWHHLRSPYGPLFTVATYPLARVPLPVAYWVLKVGTVLGSLGFIALVARIAKQLGRDPRFAVLFVAANPLVLMYGVSGFHNDVFMLIPAMASISLLLDGRDRSAGAVLMLAVAVKFTAVLLLPFLLIAARPGGRRVRVIQGTVMAAVPLGLAYLLLFGVSIPNLSDQSTLLTNFSLPNLFGDLIRIGGGTPGLLRVANVCVVLAIAYNVRRRGDWLSGAGWSTLALVASLAWLVPWYIVWVLPLAALGTSMRLRRATLIFSAFLVLTFMPATGLIMQKLNINTMNGSAGHASQARQRVLEQ